MGKLGLLPLLIIIIATACQEGETNIEPTDTSIENNIESEPAPSCPDSCDDKDICTEDLCSEDTNYECTHEKQVPCCVDGDGSLLPLLE